MGIRTETHKGATRIIIDGEMNIFNSGETRDSIVAATEGSRGLEIDLSGVSSLDTAGIQILTALKKECAKTGITLKIDGLSDVAQQAIKIYGIQGFLTEG